MTSGDGFAIRKIKLYPSGERWTFRLDTESYSDAAPPDISYPFTPSETTTLAASDEILVKLERFDTPLKTIVRNLRFLSSVELEQEQGICYAAAINIANGEGEEFANYAFYRALFLYLRNGDRHKVIPADILLVYAAWQRYGWIKRLLENVESTSGRYQWRYEFAAAHRELDYLLQSDEFSYAFYVLWINGRIGAKGGAGSPPTNAIIREKLRLSMILSPKEASSSSAEQSTIAPLPAPMCFDDNSGWAGVRLHWLIEDRSNYRVYLRSFLREWPLVRYDVLSAVRLAWMVRGSWGPGWLVTGHWPLILQVLMLAALAASLVVPLFLNPNDTMEVLIAAGLLFGVPLAVILSTSILDAHSLPHLVLPRLAGAIAIGYAALVFAGESWSVAQFLWTANHHLIIDLPAVIIPWVAALLVSGIYFWYEAHAACSDTWAAVRRAFVVVIWALLLDISIGAWAVKLGEPSWNGPNAQVSFQPIIDPACCLGSISLHAILAMAPLALLIGIVVQVIWQDRPVTATVWSPDEQ